MRKIIGWLGAAIFIALVVAVIFRVGKVRTIVTGQAPAA